ncbi:MAG: DEAD/DEAH box helicase [Thermoplasmata archaeon]
MTNFESFKLRSEILKSLDEMNFVKPTEVQEKTIPLAMEGKDLIVRSKTGTGKTGAFLIPILQNTEVNERMSSLVILPTRELAIQVFNVSKKMTSNGKIGAAVVYGGASIGNQIRELRKNPSIVIGTPGRIIDLMERGELDLSHLKFLVLDEADVMLDLGFIEDIERIISRTPKKKQSMLFSATVSEKILKLTKKFMTDPKFLKVGIEEQMTVDTLSHSYAISAGPRKVPALLAYINEHNPKKSIIFAETKRGADRLYNVLSSQGYKATVIHGDLSQAQRERSLAEFRNGSRFLVATNVASRGLDVTDVSDVINFDVPSGPLVYVHRVGRSARMGNYGSAFTIVNQDELDAINAIERTVKIHMMRIKLDQEPFLNVEANVGYSHDKGNNHSGRDSHRINHHGSGKMQPRRGTSRYRNNGRRRNDSRTRYV